MSSAPTFIKATRRAVRPKLGISGPSGSGKTKGALALATVLAQGGKVALLDTENGSASLYADQYAFETIQIDPPYLTEKYAAGVKAAIAGAYTVLVIDTISHQWDGDGGILQRKEETDARGGNHFSNWEPFSKEHNQFRALILHAPFIVISTMRSKMAYSQEANGKKTEIKKLGLQPIQREGFEYEFTLCFDVQMDHKAAASKDRTELFDKGLHDLLDPKVPQRLLAWLATAKPEEVLSVDAGESPAGAGTKDLGSTPLALVSEPEPTADTPWPGEGAMQGKTLRDWTHKALLWLCEPGRRGPHIDVWQALARDEVKSRNGKEAMHA